MGVFGGVGAIVSATVKFTSEKIAERLEKKYESRLNKELEEFKNKLENKSYVSKTRFDTEFSVYRKLSESTVVMVKEVSQLFPRFTRDTRDDYDTYKKKFDSAIEKTVIAQDSLAANAPFISKDIYNKFDEIERKCKEQIEDFIDFRLRVDCKQYIEERRAEYRNAFKRTSEIQNDWNELLEELRVYRSSLEVV
ncbi:hypothetical protein [Lactonifactor longoviformis]|uniref:hypothetical protein n=1 Tax=Lactonifactor longoviformis TaxID=341220 RepID=UPI001D008F3C|nr:hypothetical protein [Lactonifactor longoviformis]MCB5713887.1 hypothetical protein [Lactonifactor longoviformis]MCB5717909.1 hypothetical protein [Lactonifactor longoviformis]